MLAYLITTAGLAAAASAGYQSMSPTGQWYGSTFTGCGGGSKQLALTYDDGPNDPHTLRLLEVLAKHDVRATFFLIGRYAEQRPDIVRAVVAGGHVVGNHTYNHLSADLQNCGSGQSRPRTVSAGSLRCDRRALEPISSSFWRTAAGGASHRAPDGP